MTFAEIKAQLTALINRTDLTDAVAATFVQMAQNRLERWPQVDPLRYSPRPSFMEKFVKFSLVADAENPGSFTVPSDFLSIIAIYSGSTEIERVGVSRFVRYPDTSTGIPEVFMQDGHSIRLRPAPYEDTELYMIYFGADSALVDDADENVWTTACADVLIYGAAAYAADHFEDDRLARFESRFKEGLLELQDQTINEAQSGPSAIAPSASYSQDDY